MGKYKLELVYRIFSGVKMKIFVEQEKILELSETKKKVIKNDIREDIFEEDMKRRVAYVLQHKYDQCFKRLKEKWEPELKARGVKSFPSDEEEFAQLVFSQEDYRSRSQREAT